MSQQPEINPLHIERPLLRDEDADVENIYREAGTNDQPDLTSADVMGEYLESRLRPDEQPEPKVVWVPTGRTLPGIQRVPAGVKEVTRHRLGEGYYFNYTPKKAFTVFALSAVALNVVPNYRTEWGLLRDAGHAVRRVIDPVHDKTIVTHQRVTKPGKVVDINVTAATANKVGAASIELPVVDKFVEEVTQAEQKHGKILRLKVTGNTSDEWSGDASIGQPNPENTQLGKARADAAIQALSADNLKKALTNVIVTEKEHVLTPAQKAEVLAAAQADGYATITDAITAADNGTKLPTRLAQKITQFFTGKQNRGVSISASVEYPGKSIVSTKTITTKVPGHDHWPHVPEPGFYGFIPPFWRRRRERYTALKDVYRWEFTPSKQISRPMLINQKEDQAWVRLRPEALKEDGTLVENSWAYTRKYEHLLRDDRIKDTLCGDYINPKGEQKSLRIMFVDHSPAAETIEVFEGLINKFASMQEGKIADRVTGIFVYPSENAGTAHDDPKRIAIGIDKQSEEEILGTYTFALDLVELHMPTTWNPDDLYGMFESINGPAWVIAHEAGGHGTDDSDATLRLRPVRTSKIPNAHIITGEPRAMRMRRANRILHDLPEHFWQKVRPIKFDVRYQFADRQGQVIATNEVERVTENDARLRYAVESTIVGHKPTRYANTNVPDHYAETAAAVTTGIEIPYQEAGVKVPTVQTADGQLADFARGYRPDTRGQRTFTDSVGAEAGSFPVSFKHDTPVSIRHINPANDPLIRRELIRTRRLRTLEPHEMIAILARVTRSVRK